MKRSRPNPVEIGAKIVELEIEAMGAHGDGIVRHDGGEAAFVPLTLPGEKVLARLGGGRGMLEQVLRRSPERVTPPCPHFGPCGGCALQHWAHSPYLAWKLEQVRLALARERLETEFAPAFAASPGSRRRLALHARRMADGATKIGYKPRRSWGFVAIETCPISAPGLSAALPALRRFATHLFEHPKSAPTLHVTLSETGLDIDVTGVEAKSGGLSADARLRAAEAAQAGGFARATLSGETLYQSRQPVVRFGPASVTLPPGGFLQAVAGAEEAMAAFCMGALTGARRVADLFCGAGAFSFRMAETAVVLALDADPLAISALKAGIPTAPGLKPIMAEARDLYRRPLPAEALNGVEGVVFDPPRAGALDQAREIARSKVAVAVGISCNPATFARDARVLADGGFTLTRLLPVDQFLWSPHIELVGVFER